MSRIKNLECNAICGQLRIKRERAKQIEYCGITQENCVKGLPNRVEDCPYRQLKENYK